LRERLFQDAQREQIEIVGRLVEDEEVPPVRSSLASWTRLRSPPDSAPTGVSANASSNSIMRRNVRAWTLPVSRSTWSLSPATSSRTVLSSRRSARA